MEDLFQTGIHRLSLEKAGRASAFLPLETVRGSSVPPVEIWRHGDGGKRRCV